MAETQLSLIEAAALLSGSSEWDSRPLPGRGIASFVMSDGPHGIRRQLGSGDHLGIAASQPATCFPTAATVAASWDPGLAEKMGQALGREARALGVDVVLGPGLNIKRSPLCGRNFEYYSEDPLLSGRMAAGLVRGIQSEGVAATPKHYAVNSQELRRQASDSIVDERTMREIYLTAFEIVVREAHPQALMSSYNKVNGTYAHEHPYLLTTILREEWGFDGLVVSDWGGSNSAPAAAAAGGSLEMPAPGLHSVREIVAAVESGQISEADVRARAREVLAMVARAKSHLPRPDYDAEAHHNLARDIARQCVVLLRNEEQILPFKAHTRVAIIGDMAHTPRFQGAGSSLVNATRVENLLECAGQTELTVLGYAQGYDRRGHARPDLIDEATALATGADVVVVAIGLDELSESEGLDRAHMDLPRVQIDLLEALYAVNSNIVVVLSAGSVVTTAWAQYTRAIVHTHLGGQAGASAAWDVLTGKYNPSGRLAESWPHRLVDHPTSAYFPARGASSIYREGLYVGYRYFDTAQVDVAYPFGFGLSYTTFTYSDLRIDEAGVRLSVANTGEVDGDEVVQLYVQRPGTVWGPARELKGFVKVHVPAGHSEEVRIAFDEYTFRHFDTQAHQWRVEPGQWLIHIGANIADIRLSAPWVCADDYGDVEVCEVPHPYRTGKVLEATDADVAVLLGRELPQELHGQIRADEPLSAMERSPSFLARSTAKVLAGRLRKSEEKGFPDLNLLFVTNMPFRALGKMTKGAISTQTVDGIVDFVNGRRIKGLCTIIRTFFGNRRENARTQRLIDQAAQADDATAKEGH
ncbi:glycoside hydrolase family 3 C-terminal domain-containing protein [Schaalia suimastitidis]|uniref:glycoside hydrolase family 3 C-terminal domain-containing protein n=1 Tax=Schaalia suimastitidis TaxID=121163 RepID=UPI0004047D2B|nr:glycoside hydrolase family 3 C-terminal domain-containing protein [Schaalia suimastitidis]